MKRFFTIITAALTVAMFSFALPAFAADDLAKQTACESISGTYVAGVCTTSTGSVDSLIATVVNLFSWAVGLIAVIFIIYAGFRYITSGGDAGKITSAKNTLIYAVIGLVIAATAQIIVQFVLNSTTTPIAKPTTSQVAP